MTAARSAGFIEWWSNEQWNNEIRFLRRRLTEEGSGRDLRAFATSWCTGRTKASPSLQRHCRNAHQRQLADHKSNQPWKCLLHKAVGMQADSKHVHAEPREAGDDVTEQRHDRQAALPDESTPARVQNDCAPKDDQHRAIFFRVPSPEPTPRLIGPDTAEHCTDETE